MDKPALARVLPGFENIRRYHNPQGQVIAKLLPGDFYVTTHDEVLDTVLGSCVSACIRNPRLGIGGMNHFMLPRPSGNGHDTVLAGTYGDGIFRSTDSGQSWQPANDGLTATALRTIQPDPTSSAEATGS